MARARLIHPELARHEGLALLSREHRYLFALLPTIADRLGLVEDRPRRIQADLFPYDTIKDGIVAGWLDDLIAAGFLERVEINGYKLIKIPGFARWQRPHPREKASEWEPEGEPKANPGRTQGTPRSAEGRQSPSVSDPDPVSDPVPKEGGEPEKAPAAPPPLQLLPQEPLTPFLAYLAAEFPQAKAVPENEKAWAQAFPGVDLLAQARNARRWELDNPRQVRPSKRRFLGNWFARAQEQVSRASPAPPRGGPVSLQIDPQAHAIPGRKFL